MENKDQEKFIQSNWSLEGIEKSGAVELVKYTSLSTEQKDKLLSSFVIFKYKHAQKRYKARAVINGSQQTGLTFDKVWCPVARSDTIRNLIALKAKYKMNISSFDFAQAFLTADLEDGMEVYAKCPPDYPGNESNDMVWHLKKSVYGLRVSGANFTKKVARALISEGFTQCPHEPSLFVRTTEQGVIWCTLYIDDGAVVYTNKDEVQELYKRLDEKYHFTLTVEDNPKRYVGLELKYFDDGSVGIHSHRYTRTLLEAYDHDKEVKPHRLPYKTTITDAKLAEAAVEPALVNKDLQNQYRKILGSLLYLTTTTRLDILYPVHRLARYITRCGPVHLKAAKYILGYLKYTEKYLPMIVYHPDSASSDIAPRLDVFVDSGYISSEDAKSTTSWITRINYSPVGWSCGLQSINALSSCESEYIALTEALKQGVWNKQMLISMGLPTGKFNVYEDNIGTIKITAQATFFKRSKHILNRYHYVCGVCASDPQMQYISTAMQLADLNTKMITCPSVFEGMRNALMVFQ